MSSRAAAAVRQTRFRSGAAGKVDKQNGRLAPGRYWIELPPEQVPVWETWIAVHAAVEGVKVLAREEYLSDCERECLATGVKWAPAMGVAPYLGCMTACWGSGATKGKVWLLFETPVQTPWEFGAWMGWPNPAADDVDSSDDVKPKDNSSILPGMGTGDASKAWGWVPWAVGGTIIVVGMASLAKLVRG